MGKLFNDYTNWALNEPCDFHQREEDCLLPHGNPSTGDSWQWNDARCNETRPLGSPTYDLLSRRRTHLTPVSRKLILSQIEVWIDDRIPPAPLAEVLQQRNASYVSQREKKRGAPISSQPLGRSRGDLSV